MLSSSFDFFNTLLHSHFVDVSCSNSLAAFFQNLLLLSPLL
jgi:hypothetical protein